MNIKSNLKSLLADLIFKTPIKTHKDRVINKQTIKNIIINQNELAGQIKTQSPGGLIRILASDDANADSIAGRIQKHQDELGIRHVCIADKALEYSPVKGDYLYTRSVIVKLDPKRLLKSATSILHSNNFDETIRELVLENDSHIHKAEQVVIDFSSPNIAKPFHFGHLKSTILGNYLANINKFLGNHVTKLNYIGDWGTQYGLLSLGLEDEFAMQSKNGDISLRYLLDVYVKANERGRSDESFYNEAKRQFLLMDKETDQKQLGKWLKIRDISLSELKKSYLRLGIEFDAYEFESTYAKEAVPLVERMKTIGFTSQTEDGATVARLEKNGRILNIPVLRSDGASLYLTRDVAAAISRKERFNFDKMLYVVGADQERHFHCLGQMIQGLGFNWGSQLIHVKMGKVVGMSSRSGNFVLLSEIIDEATKQYIESTKNTPTTKVSDDKEELEIVGRNLALTALFVYDLRNHRTRNYGFDWEQVMLRTNRSGINLQTTHARLSSLLKRAAETGLHPMKSADELDPDALCCVESMDLQSLLCELDTCLYSSYLTMDSSPIVNHALNLCKSINRARQSDRLWVLGEENESWARTRLSLFASSRLQLGLIIKLLGLKPLDRV